MKGMEKVAWDLPIRVALAGCRQKISSPFSVNEAMMPVFPSAMNPTPQHPQPPVSMVEEWDNPAMTEFKRQEAEDRVAFGCSLEARQWLEHFRSTPPPDVVIRVARVPK